MEFLRSRDLTEHLVDFILHSIAMVDEKESTLNVRRGVVKLNIFFDRD